MPFLKEKCSKGRMKEKAGIRGWIFFGVSVPHTQTERPQAPGGGAGDRRWGGCSDDQLLSSISPGEEGWMFKNHRQQIDLLYCAEEEKHWLVFRRRDELNDIDHWHQGDQSAGQTWWWPREENYKTTVDCVDHHMIDQMIVRRRWWSGDQTYSRQSPALIRFSHRRRYSLHHLPTTSSTP